MSSLSVNAKPVSIKDRDLASLRARLGPLGKDSGYSQSAANVQIKGS